MEGWTMHCNVGGTDRVERIVHGIAFLLVAVFLVSGAWRWVLGAYGLLRLATGVFAFCPLYLPFGHRTNLGPEGETPRAPRA
jgi:hypothetical protein